jgi:hypothetical protein
MGRPSTGTEPTAPVRLFRVRLDSGGYDDGGAYWGHRTGGRYLYAATDGDGWFKTVDAASRAHAALLLGLERAALAAALPRAPRFGRWHATPCYIGREAAGYALYEFGKPAGTVAGWDELCTFAQEREQ